MSMIFCESFDHYVTADITTKWTTVSTATISSGNGRNSTASLRTTGANQNVTKTLNPELTSIVIGFALRVAGFGTSPFLMLMEGATTHVDLRLTGAGLVQVTRNGTVLGTSTVGLSTNAYAYIELKTTIHDTTGTAVLRINGTTEVNLTNQDTRNGGTGVLNTVRVNGPGNIVDVDDLYICNTSGSVNNDFLGDVRVQARMPDGNGASSQLTGSDGNSIDNYLLVDESAPNGDTDYVESATTGNKDTYAYANVTPTSGTVFAVQALAYSRKTDAGVRNVKLVARPASTNYVGAAQAQSTDYLYYREIWDQSPETSSAWTISEVNGSEFGVEVA